MEHERMSERLSEFVEGTLAAQERQEIETHLASCVECRRDVELLRRTLSLVRGMPRPSAPANFSQALRRRARKGALARASITRWIRLMVPWEAALVVLLVAVGGLCVFQLLTHQIRPVERAAPVLWVQDGEGLRAVARAAWEAGAEVRLLGRRVPPDSFLSATELEILLDGPAWERLRERLLPLGHPLPPRPAGEGLFVIEVKPRAVAARPDGGVD
ncbi:MAG: hypothetical protein GYA21_05810 [Myxococcales bacterium]|nr:hypothetical protein [Myxococcales bacterium]